MAKMKDPPKSPWASTKDDVGVRTRRRGFLPGQTPTPAPAPVIQESSPVADNQDKPRTTGLGKGKTVPPSIRREPPKARQSVKTGVRKPHRKYQQKFKKSKTHTGAALDTGNGVRKTPVDDEGQSKTEDKNPVGKAPIEDGEHATTDQKDPVGKMPVEDQEPSMTDEKHQVGRTPVEDQEHTTPNEIPVMEDAGGPDGESDSSEEIPAVDSVAQLKATNEELSGTGMIGNLIAAVALKGVVLPNSGDADPIYEDTSLFSAQAATRASFNEHGDLDIFNDPVRQAIQFENVIISVLLKKKDMLRSVRGHTVSSFLCAAAELIPQLKNFSEMAFGTTEIRNVRTKTCWHTLIWVMLAAVTGVDEYDIVPTGWTPAGIYALEKLDTFAGHLLDKRINCAPNTLDDNYIFIAFVDTDWLKNDLEKLRVAALVAEDGVLEPGDFLKETREAIDKFLTRAAVQVQRGRLWAAARKTREGTREAIDKFPTRAAVQVERGRLWAAARKTREGTL